MHTLEEYRDIITAAIEKMDLDKVPQELYEPIKYTMNLGGKRLRPTLCLLAAGMFDGSVEDALPAALAIEIFHNFTLIHDDIMDQAPIRRGKPSVYRRWNENIAILSGDAMMAMAYQYLIKSPAEHIVPLLEEFNKFAIEVCEGQQFDLNFETSGNPSLDEYINMIRLKTSVLIAGSLKIGAIIGKAPEKDANNLYEFGKNIGIAFQIKDDYLDVFGKEENFGKQTGGDILTNKKTFLYLKAYESATGEMLKKLNYYFNPSNHIDPVEKINGVKEIYRQLKIKEKTEEAMEVYYDKALVFLDRIDLPPVKKSEILRLSGQLMNRKI